MLRRVWATLSSPYPHESADGSALAYGVSCGLFVYLFFTVFEPFGFNLMAPSPRRLLFAGYGLVTGLAIVANDRLLPLLWPRFFREENWSLLRQILFMSWVTLVIALGCHLLTVPVFRGQGLPAPPLPQIVLFTFFIAVFPITIINLANHARLLRRNARVVQETNRRLAAPAQPPPPAGSGAAPCLELVAENDRDTFRVALSDLLYIQAEENYVQVHFKGEKPGRALLRSSLTRIERQLRHFYPRLFRCHRACIVNLAQVARADGNAQGLKLTLRDSPAVIPVARRYVPEFRRAIREL